MAVPPGKPSFPWKDETLYTRPIYHFFMADLEYFSWAILTMFAYSPSLSSVSKSRKVFEKQHFGITHLAANSVRLFLVIFFPVYLIMRCCPDPHWGCQRRTHVPYHFYKIWKFRTHKTHMTIQFQKRDCGSLIGFQSFAIFLLWCLSKILPNHIAIPLFCTPSVNLLGLLWWSTG